MKKKSQHGLRRKRNEGIQEFVEERVYVSRSVKEELRLS